MSCQRRRLLLVSVAVELPSRFHCRHRSAAPTNHLRRLAGFLLITISAIGQTTVAGDLQSYSETKRNHWAFRPVTKAAIPQFDANSGDARLFQNRVDPSIAASLQVSGHHMSRPADRRTLIRRITFDLIGLPPTPEEVDEFLYDTSPDAFDRVVDRLLSSPHYGEAWGRNWLDVVRFAETAGFKEDPLRPNAYTYRDYVIKAFNRDLAWDRFVTDQLAGDELYPDDAESLAATGYCRMWPDESNASNIRQARQSSLDDLTANIGAAFLGLSIGCAQCHDHKFDPLLQSDYYQLQAYFAGIVLEDKMPVGTHTELTEFRRSEGAWLDATASLRRELNSVERPARYQMQGERRMKFPADVLEALDMPFEDRNTMQRQLAFYSARQMNVKEDDIPKYLDDAAKARREELLQQMADAVTRQPRPTREANVMAIAELTTAPPATFRLEGGSYDQPREEVVPDIPSVLRRDPQVHPPAINPPTDRSSGRRSALAKWMASADNPLTHRVWVNRIWQGHFGRGLVSNANDFGTMTPAPSHPELLDRLTSDFIAGGFETKRLHRHIVASAVYRQASDQMATVDDPAANELRPAYSYYPRQRLSSERIRDAWLVASGQLNDAMFGPGIRPELPPNFSSYEWRVSQPADQARRSVYIFAKRNLPYPLMVAFDFPDMHETCGCRTQTTIAPQALMLLNNRVVLQAARQLAQRSSSEANSSEQDQVVRRAWQLVFGRPASHNEVEKALVFLDQQQHLQDATATTGERSNKDEALTDFCHALLNSNEFLFVE